MKKQLVQSVILLSSMLLTATFIYAGHPPGGGGGAGAPIDGGLSLLIGAGASYGIKKLYKKKQKTDNFK